MWKVGRAASDGFRSRCRASSTPFDSLPCVPPVMTTREIGGGIESKRGCLLLKLLFYGIS